MSNATPNHPTPTPTPQVSLVPATDFDGLIRISQMLSKSSLVPSAYRGKPENVLLAALAGQPFGWDPTMAMRSFHVIEGVPSLKPEIQLALVRRAGHSVTGETTPTGATITGKRRDTGDTMTVAYTLDDARRAGLLGKSVWKQYPQSMCWARALSQLCRMLFPDVVLGAGYTPEELGADDNDNAPLVVGETDDRVEVTEYKKALLQLLEDSGLEREDAIPEARRLWDEAGLPAGGRAAVEVLDAFLAEVADALAVDAEVVTVEEVAA